MAQQLINPNIQQPLGPPNEGLGSDQGDTWNVAVGKLNAMFSELYAGASLTISAGAGINATRSANNVTVARAQGLQGGRGSLSSTAAITTSDMTGQTSVYWVPDPTDLLSIYTGSLWLTYSVGALTQALDSNSGHTGYHQGGFNFDFGTAIIGGVPTLCSSPAWTNDTTRSAAVTTLVPGGLPVNQSSMTVRFGTNAGDTTTIGANQWSYLFTQRMTGDGLAEDSLVKRFLWNAFNQTWRPMLRSEAAGTSWTYSAAAFRQVNNNAANQLDFVTGRSGIMVRARALAVPLNDSSTFVTVFTGIGLDQGTVNNAAPSNFATVSNTVGQSPTAEYNAFPGLGRHTLQWEEYGNTGGTQTWYAPHVAGLYHSGIAGEILG